MRHALLLMGRAAGLWTGSWRMSPGGSRLGRRGGRAGCGRLALGGGVWLVRYGVVWVGMRDLLGGERRPRNLIIGIRCWAARRTRVACIVEVFSGRGRVMVVGWRWSDR